jgi:SAM-dependent methyltransferase
MAVGQSQIDSANAGFWDELCGTTLAQQLGIDEATPGNLARFDDAYLEAYPYLTGHLPEPRAEGRRLLEIGLGYGTVSQLLAERGFDYSGLDIAAGPVEMVRQRLRYLGVERPEKRVQAGSALEMRHPPESFDEVVTIGCLHHTGNLARAVGQVERVLRPGGRALVMIYNKNSYRRFRMAAGRIPGRLRGAGGGGDEEEMRAAYDHNVEGEAAPATEYTSVRGARQLFAGFSSVRVRRENFDYTNFRGRPISRDFLLGVPAHRAGLDLYINAVK